MKLEPYREDVASLKKLIKMTQESIARSQSIVDYTMDGPVEVIANIKATELQLVIEGQAFLKECQDYLAILDTA